MNMVFKEVSRKIAEGILSNSMPWQVGGVPPMAVKDGKLISGVNYLLLSQAGYSDPRWTSVSEAEKRGWKLAANESDRIGIFSTPIVNRTDARNLAAIRLVNYSQLKGPEPYQLPTNNPSETAKILLANIINTGAPINVKNAELGAPEFVKGGFTINLPKVDSAGYGLNAWNAELMFAITEFGFDKLTEKQSQADDMVKHVAHTMLCAEYGISMDSFIASTYNKEEDWINNITKDEKYVFKVAKAANQICDYINQFSPVLESDHLVLFKTENASGNDKLYESEAGQVIQANHSSESDLMQAIAEHFEKANEMDYFEALSQVVQTPKRILSQRVN